MSPLQRKVIVVGGAVEVAVTAYCLRGLTSGPDAQVNGSKAPWLAAIGRPTVRTRGVPGMGPQELRAHLDIDKVEIQRSDHSPPAPGEAWSIMSSLIRLLTGALAIALTGTTLSLPAAAAERVTVIRWSDGDTVITTAGTVRLIGIDTPERGHCGSRTATRLANRLAPPGSRIRLIDPTGVSNRADDGRLLRYVVARGRDIGPAQIKRGAWAAFDGRDGYQRHPRQARYRRLDRRHANYTCGTSQISGPVAPTGSGDCPSYAPIKGNQDSMIYHSPGQEYYAITNAEQCFRNGASAEAAGYRPARA